MLFNSFVLNGNLNRLFTLFRKKY